MTIYERIKNIIKGYPEMGDADAPASIEKMIYAAYWIGREEGTKATADSYNEILTQIKASAEASRYHKMIFRTIGNCSRPYNQNYAQDTAETFGFDKADI